MWFCIKSRLHNIHFSNAFLICVHWQIFYKMLFLIFQYWFNNYNDNLLHCLHIHFIFAVCFLLLQAERRVIFALYMFCHKILIAKIYVLNDANLVIQTMNKQCLIDQLFLDFNCRIIRRQYALILTTYFFFFVQNRLCHIT